MILIIDNYDSFTYNLAQYLGQLGAEVKVVRNDEIKMDEIIALSPNGILLSPGPSSPSRSGICLDIVGSALGKSTQNHKDFFSGLPIFGVCLGCQAMGLVSGATVSRAKNVMHGKASMIDHDGKGVFSNLPFPFRAIRYHSLAVTADTVPSDFVVSAKAIDDGTVMGIRHKTLPIEGVQFHPESVLTEGGMVILKNFLDSCA